LNVPHQRKSSFTYEQRPDTRTKYIGGSQVYVEKRLSSVSASFDGRLIHKHTLNYDIAPLTLRSRLTSITLSDANGGKVRPVTFDWTSGNPSVFDESRTLSTLSAKRSDSQVMPMDVLASGRTDVVVASSRNDTTIGGMGLNLDVFLADGQGDLSPTATAGSGLTGLFYPDQLLPIDFTGDGRADLVSLLM